MTKTLGGLTRHGIYSAERDEVNVLMSEIWDKSLDNRKNDPKKRPEILIIVPDLKTMKQVHSDINGMSAISFRRTNMEYNIVFPNYDVRIVVQAETDSTSIISAFTKTIDTHINLAVITYNSIEVGIEEYLFDRFITFGSRYGIIIKK